MDENPYLGKTDLFVGKLYHCYYFFYTNNSLYSGVFSGLYTTYTEVLKKDFALKKHLFYKCFLTILTILF